MDHDIIQIETFTHGSRSAKETIASVDEQANRYLQYNADLVHSIQPMMTVTVIDGAPWYQYTVLVSLRA